MIQYRSVRFASQAESQRGSGSRGLSGSLAAVIALTLAVAAALQAGISRLAVPDFAAVMAIACPAVDAQTGDVAAACERGPAAHTRRPVQVARGIWCGALRQGPFDAAQLVMARSGRAAMPPPVV